MSIRSSLPFADVGRPTAGYVAIGVSAFALLAVGPRVLGSSEFSSMAIAWTIANLVGAGLCQPGETTVTRVVAGTGDGRVITVVRRRLAVVTLALLALPALAAAGHLSVLGNTPLWGWAVVVFAAGWTLLAGSRGQLAAAGDFSGYSLTLVAEAVARLVLSVLAFAIPAASAPLLAAAMGVPLVVAALVGARRTREIESAPASKLSHSREQSAITIVAVLVQVSLSTAPIWLQAGSANPAVAGQYVAASAYLRIPLMLIGGLVTVVLSAVSGAHGSGDLARARRTLLRSLGFAALVGSAAVGALLLLSGVGLPLLYGSPVDLGPGTLGALGLTTVLTMVAGVASAACLGLARSQAASVAWAVVAGLVVIGLTLTSGSPVGAALVTAGGQVVALAALGTVADRATRTRRGTQLS